jgi:hypothetical protein
MNKSSFEMTFLDSNTLSCEARIVGFGEIEDKRDLRRAARVTAPRRRRDTLVVVALLLAFAGALRIGAWSLAGHTLINRAAIAALPADGPAFLEQHIDWIGARSTAPDSWRDGGGAALSTEEAPNHLWLMERLPAAMASALPSSRLEFARQVGDVSRTGTLPYAILETYQRLEVAFGGWRRRRAAHQNTSFIELDAAFYAGWLGHYVGDGGQPLHTSENHEGWIGPNSKGFTRDHSIHPRFEDDFVALIGLTEADVARHMGPPKAFADPAREVLAYLDRSHGRVDQVYSLDLRHAFEDRSNGDARELLYACTGNAATMLRDLIYTAWINSGSR